MTSSPRSLFILKTNEKFIIYCETLLVNNISQSCEMLNLYTAVGDDAPILLREMYMVCAPPACC